jgi:hypothetical protein
MLWWIFDIESNGSHSLCLFPFLDTIRTLIHHFESTIRTSAVQRKKEKLERENHEKNLHTFTKNSSHLIPNIYNQNPPYSRFPNQLYYIHHNRTPPSPLQPRPNRLNKNALLRRRLLRLPTFPRRIRQPPDSIRVAGRARAANTDLG